jgi:hypothetical protein
LFAAFLMAAFLAVRFFSAALLAAFFAAVRFVAESPPTSSLLHSSGSSGLWAPWPSEAWRTIQEVVVVHEKQRFDGKGHRQIGVMNLPV